ncbi:hypothetical protein NQ314_011744 [Rhamnusium bicolor]|uniref:Uncharacterized protein n=1 Tax=Rhamnusium bicolor TaxID=1586634 RepID=A0AAV8XGV8_9CUCU|nr:hypothetical protein NQ314_011744 [Rhamnusium bicolor]
MYYPVNGFKIVKAIQKREIIKLCFAREANWIAFIKQKYSLKHFTGTTILLDGKKLKMINEGKTVQDQCDCPPICTSMYYIVENSQARWDWKKQYDSENGTKHMSYFQIFFKNSQFITMDRNELFGATDFLANFGGLLGLFIGFSLLSLIELFYYLTLRIICNINLFGIKNWSGKTD